MYLEGNADYKFHLEHYGHPSKFGFKDVIHQWKAENWDPDKLSSLYKRAGAQYFCALANHHDNFDNFDSKYQPWNSVKIGPKKDLIGGWARAARPGIEVRRNHSRVALLDVVRSGAGRRQKRPARRRSLRWQADED
jgi:alpha-L-fucosidase